MDYAGCFMDKWLGGILFDEKRRPYYLYKGKIVRRIGYFMMNLSMSAKRKLPKR